MSEDTLRLADRIALHELRARYTLHYDAAELDAFVALFADDGMLQLGPVGFARGHEQLRTALAGPMADADFMVDMARLFPLEFREIGPREIKGNSDHHSPKGNSPLRRQVEARRHLDDPLLDELATKLFDQPRERTIGDRQSQLLDRRRQQV